ncbi:Radical SAM family enzyme, coproporphyrinogen III oxidase (oxygen-independent, clustered with nucleoside-triphosphatase RdgB) - like protein [Thioalkalivibrio nitratireducens DSM 14787]|uniref:Heme chaperone HemW n=1 Tax=Thioalkalivibrio nitratireducens (strain DSM 14787 / UNIQEM 213 / ALEN2) TaxID=1255043 RepID=L0E1W1_THIND|nr:radical SAM family heme chaperone HemW [Thioalkalivibrio nitratireducens]AGA35232.1 Radical SAM family enzyme, coproporphyrinogen III oxidase (oxygen-independent, clustered with nucleoside-triphosphatase RdgB) - like protein [Thioalkalivibrio nitratireducens DSM 14787]
MPNPAATGTRASAPAATGSWLQHPPPLALYVHLPWCLRKCPYCDFNSHAVRGDLPEEDYVEALLRDLESQLPAVWGRRLESIFIGGGTPSLFSPEAIDRLLAGLRARLPWRPDLEITLEANPGTAERGFFRGYREAGVNRLSLGVQSFDPGMLTRIGRIHDDADAHAAIAQAHAAGFENLNLDLMFGLPGQSLEQGLTDLRTAVAAGPSHVSWYQLTLEPNTLFAAHPPPLPADETVDALFSHGQSLLQDAGYTRYEVSAYAKTGNECRHNLNYWEFGDYLGIGAGAHGKLTDVANGTIRRLAKPRQPEAYLRDPAAMTATPVARETLPFEFMLNALRLTAGVPAELFPERTGLTPKALAPQLEEARERGLLCRDPRQLRTSPRGLQLLNDLLQIFLNDHDPPR